MGDLELTREEELSGFRVRSRVGRGPRGSIWSAVDPLTGDKAVIKVIAIEHIPEEKLDAHVRSWLETWASLRVTGLSTLRNATHLSGPYIYTLRDFAPGRSLRELAHEGVTVNQALDLVARAARIIAAAHGAKLVHGNLSLDNIFVTPAATGQEGVTLTITDAGIANLAPLTGASTAPPTVNDDLIALAKLAHELIYRHPADLTTPRFDPLGALLSRAWSPKDETFTDVIAFADALEDLRATYPNADRPLVTSREESPPPAPHELLPEFAAESLNAPPKTPHRRPRGLATGFLRAGLGLLLSLAALSITYRILLDRWPGQAQQAPTLHATLELLTQPQVTEIRLDGRVVGQRTPIKLHVPRGRPLRLALTHEGYRPWTQTIALAKGEEHRRIEIHLIPRALRWGTLKLSTNVQANIFLDDRCVGTQTREVTLAEVRAGVEHRLRLSAPGHRDLERIIRVPAGKVHVVEFHLTPRVIAGLPLRRNTQGPR